MKTKQLIKHIGKTRGRFTSKSNKAAKLVEQWKQLEAKLTGMIERGHGRTESARLAYATLLMMETGVRVGNESSAEGWICENQIVAQKSNPEKGIKKGDILWRHPMYGKHVQTFGLTTLQNRHVTKFKNRIEVSFVGKKIVEQSYAVWNPTLLKYCPKGKNPDSSFLHITYPMLKKFVKKYVGKNYTPKDIRMAKVNLIFVDILGTPPMEEEFESATTKSERKRVIAESIEETAAIIGHTKGVCRSAYLSAPLIDYVSTLHPLAPKC